MVLGKLLSLLFRAEILIEISAVATSESGIGNVILYSTQTMRPICTIEGIHYANMTDLAWCPSGNHLFVSSRDG